MISIAKSRCQNCVQADIENLPYADERFDLVFVNSALHHFPSLDAIFKQVRRTLKTNGLFAIQEPNAHSIHRDFTIRVLETICLKLGLKTYPDVTDLEIKPSDHHAPLTVDRVISTLEKVDFNILHRKKEYYTSYYFSRFDNSFIHSLSTAMDAHYVHKYSDGYLFTVIAQKQA